MRKVWVVEFDENGGEYIGRMYIHAEKVERSTLHPYGFFADGVYIQFDERIIDVFANETSLEELKNQ